MKKILLFKLFLFSTFVVFSQTNLSVTNINSADVTLNWDNGGCTNANYLMRYRESSASSWVTATTIPNTGGSETYFLTGLNPSTTYNWKVKCGNNGSWENGQDFTTSAGCLLTSSISITDASCSNTMNGSANLTVNNGLSPYSYLWSNGATTQNLIDVTPGTYTVQISDANGCTLSDTAIIGAVGAISISQSLTQFSPNPLTAYHQWSYDTLNLTNTGCNTRIRPEFSISCDSGAIQQGDFILKWQHPGGWNQTLDYTIDGNGNANGYWSFTANDSTGFDLTYGQIQDVVIQVKFVNPALFGTYTASWNTYEVDNAGNIISLLTPTPTTINLSLINCSLFTIDSTSTTSTTCVGGTDGNAAINSVSNGSGQYSFLWSNGEITSIISNVASGYYNCIVTDDNWGCSDSVNIFVPSADTLQASLTGTNISCFGLADGTLTASATGGSGTYKYTWNPSLPLVANHTGLSSNTYILVLIDMGCPNSSSTDSFTISEPAVLSYTTASNNNTSCDINICNGSFGINLSGGTTPYSFTWTNGDSVNLRNDLCGGSYSITASDLNSCNTFTESVIIYDSSFTPSVLVLGTDISCNGSNNGSSSAMISTGGSSSGNISTLTYCASSPGTNSYANIELVRIIGDGDSIVNNTTGICDTYEDYTSQFTSITPGGTYSIDVNLGTCDATGGTIDSGGVFIDWNIDGDFTDPGEKVGVFGGVQSPTSNTISFNVPNGHYGATRMRIVSQAQMNNSGFPDGPISPCVVGDFGSSGTYNQPWYGSTEDYSIVIVGVVPATYLWNTGDTTNIISNLSAGTYYCTVTDTNNCSATDTVTIVEPSLISTTSTITNVSCNSGSDGSATLNINGGTPGFTQDWEGFNPYSLTAGTYNYTITDTNGCNYFDSVTISEPIALSVSSVVTNNICNGDSNGSVDITISGGTTSYSYSWSDGSTNEDLTNAISGTYYLTVTDANSCILSDTFIISEPSAISVSSSTTDVSCFGYSDGTASLNISGGTPGYTEDWGTYNSSSLSSGIFSYTITDTNSCIFTNTVMINEPPSIVSVPTIINVSCNGLSDGTTTLSISGGTPGYTEDWGTNNPLSLAAGTYSYTITDTNSCTYTSSVTITEPQILNATYTQTNVSCNGFFDGTAEVIITGGTTDYLLSWDTLTYPLLGGVSVFNTPIGVPAGVYPFGITDVNGCYFSDTITITQPDAISVSETLTNVSCNGLSDGTAILYITGGTPGYLEDWGTNNPSTLSSGIFSYTVTDTNSCVYTNSISISEPNVLSSSVIPTDLTSCLISNGSIDLSVNGGTIPYSYSWNNSDTTEDLSNLSAGNYSVIITDINGCTDTNWATLNQPSNGLSLSLSSPSNNGYNIACFGENSGSIIANSAGGTGSLTYIWSSGDTTQNISNLFAGSYSVAITDSVGCSLSDSISITEPFELTSVYSTVNVMCYSDSTGSAIVNFSGGVTDYILSWTGYTYPLLNGLTTFITPVGVPAGIYPYSVMDANGCFHFDTITITEPTAITVSSYTTNVSCNGGNNGTSILTSSGGTGTLTENWGGNNPMAFAAGTYNYIVTDDNLCVESGSVTITEPTSLSLSLSGTDNSCYNSCDGEITSSVYGGVSPYTYSWNNGSNSDSLSNLCIGNYSVDITDANGCIISDIVIITQPSEITINTDSIIEVSVYDGNDGEIYITTFGGVGSHSYSWTGPSFSSTNEDLIGLFSGDYIITVTDSTNCSNSDTIFVNQPPSLSIYIDTVINLLCFEECNGQVNITADGGDSVYTYLWIGPNGFTSTDEDLNSLCAGTYEIIVSDTTSSISTTITILQATQLQMITNVDTALCFGGTAQATAYTYGGQYPYITNWDNGTSAITAYLTAGIHYVNVQDVNGCSISDSVMIIQNDSIIANTITTDISCYGLTDGSVQINIISGGTSPFTYSSNSGVSFQSNNVFSSLNNVTYSYIIMDDNGCTTTISDSIIEPTELVVLLTSTSVSCNGECDGTAIATSLGGTGNITEDWGILDQNNLCAGLANVIVEDDNGCLSTNSVIITEPNPIIVIITANGNSLDASSGFVSYQWFDGNGNAIIGATSQSFIPTLMGEYYVEVIDQNGCKGESTKINFIIESIENENNLVSVYPNPTNSWITISSSIEITENIRIINTHGETVITIEKEEINNNSKRVNMDGFSKGIYLIQLINNDYIINHKVILQ